MRQALMGMETSDGVTWTNLGATGWLLEVSGLAVTSPSIIAESDGSYTMFCHNGSTQAFVWRTSADGITWGAENVCTTPANWRVWHTDVIKKDGVYHALCQQKFQPERPSSYLTYATSTDKTNWTAGMPGGMNQAIHGEYTLEPKAFAGGGYYRSSLVPRADGKWDVFFSSLVSAGSGDGDTSGDTVGAPGLYQRTYINFARGVDLTKTNKWRWHSAPTLESANSEFGFPLIHTTKRRLENGYAVEARRGFAFRYVTDSGGLSSGAAEQVTEGVKPWLGVAGKGITALMGRMDVWGSLVSPESTVAGVLVSGRSTAVATSLAHATSGQVTWNGTLAWGLVMNTANPPSPAVDNMPQPGDLVIGLTSGARAKVFNVTQSGRFIELIAPENRFSFQAGEQISIAGVTYTASATPITIASQQAQPASNGIGIVFWPHRPSNPSAVRGGYVGIWNTTTTTFHGSVDYRSAR
jgi:hypothetical protein